MSNKPVILFLHGIGNGDQEDKWKISLEGALTDLGYPNLDTIEVIAPKYAHALKGWDEKVALPDVTIKQPSRDEARRSRRIFERRTGAIEFRLGHHDRGNGQLGGDAMVAMAVDLPPFKQAHNYLNDPQIRAQVLRLILKKLPDSGNLVIVGHSLGSVIAADLLRRLPVGLPVVGMITIGSPLANSRFDVDKLQNGLEQPPANLSWWVNFWNAPDRVAAHRGVSSVFPWMIDFQIDTKRVGKRAHSAVEYLSNEAVAAAVGFALFGSQSKELAKIETGFDIPLDDAENVALVALRYAHLLKAQLKGDQKDRFAGALRHVQATVVDDIRRRNTKTQRPFPSEIALLAFDLSDPDAPVPQPRASRHLDKESAVGLLTTLAAANVIRPFEISLSQDNQQNAMKELTAEMGLGSSYGAHVFEAAKHARGVLGENKTASLIKWGAVGVGAAAIVVATGGLALAAGPGLAGAAVITSALASFGPGGMIGGLLTAGTLVTAGGGGIALGLASPGTTAATFEAVVERRLAAVILRQMQNLDKDPDVWEILVRTELEVRREHERLDEFSDESSPTLKELKRKIDTVERALKYLTAQGLEPDVSDSDSEEVA